MTAKDGPAEPKLPSHTTSWAPRTHFLHDRAKAKLGTKTDTQIVRHEDIQTGDR